MNTHTYIIWEISFAIQITENEVPQGFPIKTHASSPCCISRLPQTDSTIRAHRIISSYFFRSRFLSLQNIYTHTNMSNWTSSAFIMAWTTVHKLNINLSLYRAQKPNCHLNAFRKKRRKNSAQNCRQSFSSCLIFTLFSVHNTVTEWKRYNIESQTLMRSLKLFYVRGLFWHFFFVSSALTLHCSIPIAWQAERDNCIKYEWKRWIWIDRKIDAICYGEQIFGAHKSCGEKQLRDNIKMLQMCYNLINEDQLRFMQKMRHIFIISISA